jgi:hypothetical protein
MPEGKTVNDIKKGSQLFVGRLLIMFIYFEITSKNNKLLRFNTEKQLALIYLLPLHTYTTKKKVHHLFNDLIEICKTVGPNKVNESEKLKLLCRLNKSLLLG